MTIPRIYAHRGASADAPENTLAAFDLARSLGADGIEFDVRVTADGKPIIHHDPVLADGRTIAETASADLPAEVPALAAALEACLGGIVNVEIKNLPGEPGFDPDCALVDLVVAAIGASSVPWDDIVVSSFHPPTLDRVRALVPDAATAVLTFVEPTARDSIDLAVAGGHGIVHPFHAFVDAPFMEAARAAGLLVNTWTVDDPERMQALAALGVDGIVTNTVATARTALGAD